MALWKVDQAAEYLGIRPKTLYEWVRLGRVPYRKIGFNVRFDPEELEEWTAGQSRGRPPRRPREAAAAANAGAAAEPAAAAVAADRLRSLAADAAQTLRELERDLGASLSYPQRRRLSDLAERLDDAVGSGDPDDLTSS
jgi:excisionase family DNA binding protein